MLAVCAPGTALHLRLRAAAACKRGTPSPVRDGLTAVTYVWRPDGIRTAGRRHARSRRSRELAALADDGGFHYLTVPDHFVLEEPGSGLDVTKPSLRGDRRARRARGLDPAGEDRRHGALQHVPSPRAHGAGGEHARSSERRTRLPRHRRRLDACRVRHDGDRLPRREGAPAHARRGAPSHPPPVDRASARRSRASTTA